MFHFQATELSYDLKKKKKSCLAVPYSLSAAKKQGHFMVARKLVSLVIDQDRIPPPKNLSKQFSATEVPGPPGVHVTYSSQVCNNYFSGQRGMI